MMPEKENKPLVLLVAIDFESESTVALETAVALARRAPPAVVHAIHVVEPLLSTTVTPLASVDFQRQARAQLELLISREHLEEVVIPHVHIGTPGGIIVRISESLWADIIVIGTHGRKGLERLLVGSVAELVVREALCSVLVARERRPESDVGIEPSTLAPALTKPAIPE
ncbi:MAG: universal stress protein [Polyangiaceae bacterium]